MIIKNADDRTSHINILNSFLSRHDVTTQTKKLIEREIKNIQAGVKGEKEAAYEIGFHFGQSKNWAILHDLRLECDGRVAQIDHLIINRFLDIWVCESKHFSEGISVNEHGECSAFFASKAYGVASPFEQNRKHIAVLQSVFKTGQVKLPTRLGIAISPNIDSLILISKNARISRPKVKIDGIDSIIKNDQIKSRIDKILDNSLDVLSLAKVIGIETLEDFANQLVKAHRPIEFNWEAKFGISTQSINNITTATPSINSINTQEINKLTSSKLAQKLGIKTNDLMEKLLADGFLELKDNKHYLTAKGKEAGGEFRMSPKFGPYFLWPENFKL